jgi:uncharacterized repeat protein (TIGR03803 family)
MRQRNGLSIIIRTLATLAAMLMLAGDAAAQVKYKSLYRFTGGKDGAVPVYGLVLDQAGNLYGTTTSGGQGYGVAFKVTPNKKGGRTESVLYSFCRLTACADGAQPGGALIFDKAGNLYGTTTDGGGRALNGGTVFELSPNQSGGWKESVIYAFCALSRCVDGANPYSGLVFDQAGNLYGTTSNAGANGEGNVFELSPNRDGSWTETVLYSFCSVANCADGQNPYAGVILDQTGNIYGTTGYGGTGSGGVVFELSPNQKGGWTESVLHSFCSLKNCADGHGPSGDLIFDHTGNLYGTTNSGGAQGVGAVFELTPKQNGAWMEKVLHSFCQLAGCTGQVPSAGLVFDQTGNLYGTTVFGGTGGGFGVVFRMTPKSGGGWSYRVVHNFLDKPGAEPGSALILDPAGNLYGTTDGDTSTTFGSVFEITP